MRQIHLSSFVSLLLCGYATASGTFTPLQTPGAQLTMISGNGSYAVGLIGGGVGYRWTAASGDEEAIAALSFANGINNDGTIAGAIPENGGANNGGRDLAAYAPIGADPVQLTDPLLSNADGYAIADDGTEVGLAFEDNFAGAAVAFVWTAADGMSALPVTYPDNYSRANVISSDGHVIAGWNDQDNGTRAGVVWQDRVPFDVVDPDGNPLGEADGISSNGQFVVGSGYADAQGNSGSWLWSAADGVVRIPNMAFAFGVSDDGKTVVGSNGFFDNPARAALIWREGVGTVTLVDYLAEEGIDIPAGWDPGLAGGFTGISADGLVMGGWSAGPDSVQSYIIRIDADDSIFADGFDG